MEALCEVDAIVPDECQGLGIFDALGDRFAAEPLGQVDDRLDHMLVGRAPDQPADELDIDLQIFDRQPFQVGERSKAGTKVIEGEGCSRCRRPAGKV